LKNTYYYIKMYMIFFLLPDIFQFLATRIECSVFRLFRAKNNAVGSSELPLSECKHGDDGVRLKSSDAFSLLLDCDES